MRGALAFLRDLGEITIVSKDKTLSVDDFLANLKHARLEDIKVLRAAILGADTRITERVKWNAPSFCWKEEDRVTMRLHPGDRLQLIFHRGAKPKDVGTFAFDDSSGLIEWVAADRGVLDVDRLPMQQDGIVQAVIAWMRATTTD